MATQRGISGINILNAKLRRFVITNNGPNTSTTSTTSTSTTSTTSTSTTSTSTTSTSTSTTSTTSTSTTSSTSSTTSTTSTSTTSTTSSTTSTTSTTSSTTSTTSTTSSTSSTTSSTTTTGGTGTWTARPGVSMPGASVNGFYEYLPPGYSVSNPKPCIIYVHGLGDVGNGTTQLSSLLANAIPMMINLYGFPYDCIVICPQFSVAYPGGGTMQNVINYVKNNYYVQTNRIYWTGLSMGGGSILDWADGGTVTDIAAMAPLCPASVPQTFLVNSYKAANMPFWFFHGTLDGTVSYSNSTQWVNALNGVSPVSTPIIPTAELTPLVGADHNIWNTVYDYGYNIGNGQNLYQWLLSKQRLSTTTSSTTSTTSSTSSTTSTTSSTSTTSTTSSTSSTTSTSTTTTSGLVQSGLIMELDAANISSYPGSGTSWNNIRGLGFSATLSNTTFSTDGGGSIVFNGTNSEGSINPANFTNIPTGNSDRTISAYVKLANLDRVFQLIFAYGDTSNNYNGFFFGAANTTGLFAGAFFDGAYTDPFWDTRLNQWILITVTKTGVNIDVYANTTLIFNDYPLTTTTTNTQIRIGRQIGSFTDFWGGKIRAISIYNRALTAGEIATNHAFYVSTTP